MYFDRLQKMEKDFNILQEEKENAFNRLKLENDKVYHLSRDLEEKENTIQSLTDQLLR